MKIITFLISSLLLISCSSKKETPFISDLDKIEKVEVYKGHPQIQGSKIEMQDNFEEDFVKEIRQAEESKLTATKILHEYVFIFYKSNNKIDTLWTNGQFHKYEETFFETKENLIDKYKK